MAGSTTTPAEFFEGSPQGKAIYDAVALVVATLGDHEVRVTRSQVVFRRRRAIAYLWRPGQYIRSDVPAVLSLPLSHEIASPRFKEIVRPSRSVWMHHLELRTAAEVDEEVRAWLALAYVQAG